MATMNWDNKKTIPNEITFRLVNFGGILTTKKNWVLASYIPSIKKTECCSYWINKS